MTERSVPRGAYTRGYLPHRDERGLIHTVTFRLADALPQSVTATEDPVAEDGRLGRGLGACVLRLADCATVVRAALHHFDGARYDLGPWVIMPNHVHALLRLLPGFALGNVMHSWKSFTATRINVMLGRSGALWQREFHDRTIRNHRHLAAAIHYIEQNPVAAGLVRRAVDWPWGSAGNREYAVKIMRRTRVD